MRLRIDDKLALVYCLQRRKEQARSSQDIRFASLSLPPGFPSREASQRDDGKRPGQPPSPWPCDPPWSQGRPKRDSDHAYRVCLPLLGSPHPHVGSRPIASLSLPPSPCLPALPAGRRPREIAASDPVSLLSLGAHSPMWAPVPSPPSPWALASRLGPVPV